MLEMREQLAAAVEGAEGVAETLAGSDCILHADGKFTPTVEMGDRPLRSSSISPFSPVPGLRSATIGFRCELKGSGTPGEAPQFGPLLKACGFQETTVVSTSVTYTPASSSIPSMTLALYMDGVASKIWGARGTVKLLLEAGKPGWLEFLFTGADFAVSDASLLTGMSYDDTVAPAWLSANLSMDSYQAMVSKLDIDVANDVQLRPDANSSSGHKSAVIVSRLPVLTIDPEKILVASYDFYTKMRAGNQGALTTVVGSEAGNICTITAPKIQYSAIDDTARNKIRSLGIDCRLNRDTGDDELSLSFT